MVSMPPPVICSRCREVIIEAAQPSKGERASVVCLRCQGRGDNDVGRCSHCFDPLPRIYRRGLCDKCWALDPLKGFDASP